MVPRLRDSRILASPCRGARFTQPSIHSLTDPCTILFALRELFNLTWAMLVNLAILFELEHQDPSVYHIRTY